MKPRVIFLLAFLLTMISNFCPPTTSSAFANQIPDKEQDDEKHSPNAGMLRYPDVSQSKIVFRYANDLWTVSREGGLASPLTSVAGVESLAKFNGDGSKIAFVGNYNGNRDLYTMEASGGAPQRVTHHPASEVLCDWTPDGQLLYYMESTAGRPISAEMFTVSESGGLPKKTPVPYGADGAISDDGQWLAYTPHSNWFYQSWKRYRGGTATDIWLFNLKDQSWRSITDWEGPDGYPMWHGKKVYYISDQNKPHRFNIWSYDLPNGERKQVTRFTDFDVKSASMGPGSNGKGEIVFENGGKLHLLDLETEKVRSVSVLIPGDRPRVGTASIDASKFIHSFDISPSGKRAAVEARGDIWTLPAENGSPRNITHSSSTVERYPTWSPDGQWIAYFCDKSGENELYVSQSDGKGEAKQLTTGNRSFYKNPVWSPNSKSIAYLEKTGDIWLHQLDIGETTKVDTDPWSKTDIKLSFSHDSRWLAYSKRSGDRSAISSVWIFGLDTGNKRQVTSGQVHCGTPAFDRKGDYLYYVTAQSFSPTHAELDNTFVYENPFVIVAAPLRTDVKHPYLRESDEETFGGDAKENKTTADAEKTSDHNEEIADDGISGLWEGLISGGPIPASGMPLTISIAIDESGKVTGSSNVKQPNGSDLGTIIEGTFDPNTGELIIKATFESGLTPTFTLKKDDASMTGTAYVPQRDMTVDIALSRGTRQTETDDQQTAAHEQVEIEFKGFEARTFKLNVPAGKFGTLAVNNKNQLLFARLSMKGAADKKAIMMFDLADDGKAEKTVTDGATDFKMSSDGKKIIVARNDSYKIHNAGASASGKKVVTKGMNVEVDERAEWRMVFLDTWRIFRDYFYDQGMHGVNWADVRDHYAPMIEDCANRDDVDFVINEMIAELNCGHTNAYGPPAEKELKVETGMLGVDFAIENGAYRIAKIHEGADWQVAYRNPLRAAGVHVGEGEYLLAVNGTPINLEQNPYAAFARMAGHEVTLTVSKNATLDKLARDVVVVPVTGQRAGQLRYQGWIEANRKHVDDKSSGKVGYIYISDYGPEGLSLLVRQFYSQHGKEALIVDQRWNGGGWNPDRFLEILNRPASMYRSSRDGLDNPLQRVAHLGPKCMLMNGLSGSSADFFPWMFRDAGLGKLIGTRTWGGVVGLSGNPGLIDGHTLRVPTRGSYELDGTWIIEGHGVDPDFEIIDDPSKMLAGEDPQLDFAINHMLSEIKKNGYSNPKRPAGPNRKGMGVKPEDK